MKKLKLELTRFINDDSGQSTTEYILILSVVVMLALKFKTVFGSRLDSIMQTVGGQIDQATSNQQ